MANSADAQAQTLTGRAIIVTGAAQGIGRGIAAALLSRGASVLAVDRNSDTLETTISGFATQGFTAEPLRVDLRDPTSPSRIVDTALDRFGRIDGIVNNAVAANEPKPFTEITEVDYDLVFDTGPRATFRLMQAVYPTMAVAGGGVIVNLGSGSGTAGLPKFGAYAAAKEAIRGMSKVAALEWGADNIRVNVVCPFANSEAVQMWREYAREDFDRALAGVPLKRVGDTRDDVGAVVSFLMSDDASYLTGQTIHVDGGQGTFR